MITFDYFESRGTDRCRYRTEIIAEKIIMKVVKKSKSLLRKMTERKKKII